MEKNELENDETEKAKILKKINPQCFNCHEFGHISRFCPLKKGNYNFTNLRNGHRFERKSVKRQQCNKCKSFEHATQECSAIVFSTASVICKSGVTKEESKDESEFIVASVGLPKVPLPLCKYLKIEEADPMLSTLTLSNSVNTIQCLLDTGSSLNLIGDSMVRHLKAMGCVVVEGLSEKDAKLQFGNGSCQTVSSCVGLVFKEFQDSIQLFYVVKDLHPSVIVGKVSLAMFPGLVIADLLRLPKHSKDRVVLKGNKFDLDSIEIVNRPIDQYTLMPSKWDGGK
jgi:hypothetical protein